MKTHGLRRVVPLFLTQKSFTQGRWLGLANVWWLVNLLEDPNNDPDDTTMGTDESRCVWELYYGCCPASTLVGCIHLLAPFNCAYGGPIGG